ncbi:MAG TPA: ATP-binding cassette domain-containing protein, partial [Xanthobacteraceae bacterium]|nr:ATP-binding cassette domain-containing protein [Xanthobacteraceae bacterium]
PLASGNIEFGSGFETRVGFVFQTDALLPWSTASSNIELALRLAGASAATARSRARALLAHVGLGNAADLFPGQLSGGMRKRVAIARALAYDPAVFLMDESFSALDAQTRIHVGNFFLGLLAESQQTVVFVTHDIEEAVVLADRVLVMSHGPGRSSAKSWYRCRVRATTMPAALSPVSTICSAASGKRCRLRGRWSSEDR